MKDYVMRVARPSLRPVIGKHHPGSAGNDQGYENGHVVRHDGAYHMVITEAFDENTYPGMLGLGWNPGRFAYWKSADGDNWERVCTIFTGTNLPGDVKSCAWSASWYWNASENRWNILWRGKPLLRFRSEVEGPGGIAGPYVEARADYPPLEGEKQYWCMRDHVASFSNIYTADDGRYYAFFGADDPTNPIDPQWVNGLITAEQGSVDGPWTRVDTGGHPTLVYSENPFVNVYDNPEGGKVYFCVYDDLSNSYSIGYGWSSDGIHWTGKTLDLTGSVDWAANDNFVWTVRTPCSLIREDDGTYTIIFTARHIKDDYACVARVNVTIDKVEKPSDEHVVFPGDMTNWKPLDGDFEVQYGREYSQRARDRDDYSSVYTAAAYKDVAVEASLRWVEQARPFDHVRAGVHIRKKTIDGNPAQSGYRAYLTADDRVQLYAGERLLGEVDVGKRPCIFRKLKLTAQGCNIKVYYEGAPEPCIEVRDDSYPDAGYAGLVISRAHWHYDRVEITDLGR